MSRTSKAWEALQNSLSQAAETVTRSSRVDIVSGGVDEIDPPEDIDEYAELVKETGIVRANLRKFVNDVWEPGYRVEGPDETVQYFEGEKEDLDAPVPDETPDGGFLSQAAVYGGEKHQEFYSFGKEATYQRWVRGTVLVEYLKADRTDPESEITGFHFIRPETVYPRVENNTNILLPADKEKLPEDISLSDVDLTPRDEVAAYVQFDDESVLGLRRNGFTDKQDIPLSQNDVLKQTLEPDIGGDIGTAEGVFGTSVIEAINEDITEYKQIKRDRAEAIGRKAYGIWTAQFTKETYEFGNTTEVVEWGDDAIENTEKDLQDLGPGDVLTSDAGIDLERFDGSVPELEPTLMHYVDDIMSALPAPKYLTGFSNDINRDVASDQESGYHDLVSEERNIQEESWTTAIREVARRKGLDTEGLKFKIQPKQEDNPVKSLSTEEIDRMNTYVSTLNQAAGPQAGPTALVDGQEILEVMDFPVQEVSSSPDEIAEEMADSEATQQAWEDIMGLESLATQYSEGDVVQTPQGLGIVSGVFTEAFDDVEASDNSPAYAVGLKDERVGSEFYKASQLEEGELPEVDVEDPAKDIEAMVDIANASGEWEALDWSNPESWRESETPARVIALKAWADMNGQFDCGGGCCMGDLKDAELCGSFKDYILGTTEWRGWGA